MSDKRSIILSRDGSHTLFHPDLNETYHSTHGALRESIYVYITQGLDLFRENKEVHIIEVGFGTGLNALLTWHAAEHYNICIHYHTLEPFPLKQELIGQLNYPSLIDGPSSEHKFKQLHSCSWDEDVVLSSHFMLHKYHSTLEAAQLPDNTFHLCYFDAFAPSRQPEVWSDKNLLQIYTSLQVDGSLVTYCAQGAFKRTMKAVGFEVQVLPGPPFKVEMIRGLKK